MTNTTGSLRREIGARSIALTSINVMVGTGIFVLPAMVAEGLGAAAILVYLVCGVLVLLLALCFAELGSATSKSGGPYTYIENAFGPYAGFLGANLYLVGTMATDAALANALCNTLQIFIPALHSNLVRIIFQLFIFSALAWLNISSVKNGVRLVAIAGFGKILPLIVLVLIATPHMQSENLQWTIQPGLSSISAASLLLFFAFLGFETPLCNGGEIKNPSRSVPVGIFCGVAVVLMLYISIQLVTQGVLGSSLSLNKEAPLAAVANVAFGNPGMVFILIVTVVSILGTLGGEILSMPRVLFAAAKNDLAPKPLAKIHPRFATPHVAIVVYAAFDFILAVSGTFRQLAILGTAAILLMYLGAALASIRLRRTTTKSTAKTFKVPGGITIPVIAAGIIIWMLTSLSRTELTGITVFIILFSAIYFVVRTIKSKPNE